MLGREEERRGGRRKGEERGGKGRKGEERGRGVFHEGHKEETDEGNNINSKGQIKVKRWCTFPLIVATFNYYVEMTPIMRSNFT